MPGMNIPRIPYKNYYMTIKRLKTPNSKGSGKTVLVSYTISNLALNNEKISKTVVDNLRLNWVDSILTILDWSRTFNDKKMIRNLHAEIRHVETKDWQS